MTLFINIFKGKIKINFFYKLKSVYVYIIFKTNYINFLNFHFLTNKEDNFNFLKNNFYFLYNCRKTIQKDPICMYLCDYFIFIFVLNLTSF